MKQMTMDNHIQQVMQDCTQGSDDGRLTFPQVVMKLTEVKVESYHADLRRAEKTYYMPNGESFVTPAAPAHGTPPLDFSAPAVVAALKEIQAQTIDYQQFCERIVAAGCVGYLVSLAGRRAVYFGRTGDFHIEHFPGAKP